MRIACLAYNRRVLYGSDDSVGRVRLRFAERQANGEFDGHDVTIIRLPRRLDVDRLGHIVPRSESVRPKLFRS